MAAAGVLPTLLSALAWAAAAPPVHEYDVSVGPGAEELRVEARLAPAAGPDLTIGDGLGPYLRDVESEEKGSWRPLARGDEGFTLPSRSREVRRVRYHVLLGEAARALHPDRALERRGVFVAPPSSWLLRPAENGRHTRYRFRVQTAPGVGFATGVFVSASAPGAHELGADDLPYAPFSVFGALDLTRLEVAGGVVEAALAPGDLGVSRQALLDWIGGAARTVAAFYGRFPVPRVLVLVLPGGRRAISHGVTLGNGGASILLRIGSRAREEDLRQDWVLTHEMVHLALPNLPLPQRWLEEGIAAYVEPIARARAGVVPEEVVWRGMMDGMPRGQPEPGDHGLDRTHTWGRTYWGGALFCLLADVEIRERTGNRRSLADALRGVLDAGGSIAARWDLVRVLKTADRAVGMPVLERLHARMGSKPSPGDLDGLWRRLGVVRAGDGVVFDDGAPLTSVRRAITGSRAASQP